MGIPSELIGIDDFFLWICRLMGKGKDFGDISADLRVFEALSAWW